MNEIEFNGNILIEEKKDGFVYLKKKGIQNKRKLLFINDYGMSLAWELIKKKTYPTHHLWGCVELLNLGYEVILPKPVQGNKLKQYLKNDSGKVLKIAISLSENDIIYCAHNALIWTTLSSFFGLIKAKIVGLLFAKEPLLFPGQYDGIIAHTPTALRSAQSRNKKPKCKHISWGMDLNFFPEIQYDPKYILSCGKTLRDFDVIEKAAKLTENNILILHPDPDNLKIAEKNVQIIDEKTMRPNIYINLINKFYHHAAATLITMYQDLSERHAPGFTNAFESMAAGRPLICSKTNAFSGELDIEEMNIGLFVQPSNPDALKEAINWIFDHPNEAKKMGAKGRLLCEQKYSITRFAEDLDIFFDSL